MYRFGKRRNTFLFKDFFNQNFVRRICLYILNLQNNNSNDEKRNIGVEKTEPQLKYKCINNLFTSCHFFKSNVYAFPQISSDFEFIIYVIFLFDSYFFSAGFGSKLLVTMTLHYLLSIITLSNV